MIRFAAGVAILFTICCSSRADVGFTTLDKNGGWSDGAGSSVEGSGGRYRNYIADANAFTPTATEDLTSIEMALFFYDGEGPDNIFNLMIVGNNPSGGPLTSQVLMTGTFAVTADSSAGPITTYNYSGPALPLSIGTTYWLILAPYNSSSNGLWLQSDQSTPSTLYESSGSSSNFTNAGITESAFQINVQPVPEPTVITFGIAGLFLCIIRKLRLSALGSSIR